VTESIWQALNEAAFERGLPTPDPAAESVMIALWPDFPRSWQDPTMERRIARRPDLGGAVRGVRRRYDAQASIDRCVPCRDEVAADFRLLAPFITALASVGRLECGSDVRKPPQSGSHVQPEFEVHVSLAGLIDKEAEIKRVEKQLAEKKKHLQATQAKLANEN